MANNTVMLDRLALVRAKLDDWDVDGVYITNATNRRWLSGFTGSSGYLVITRDQAIIATDSRYTIQAAVQSPHFTLYKQASEPDEAQRVIEQAGVHSLAVEGDDMTVSALDKLRSATEGVQWQALDNLIAPLRQVKSEDELATISRAAAITDRAMQQVPLLATPGMTERELAWALERFMRESGADALAFEIIVASGPNAARPHHHPGDRELQEGDAIIIDMGAALDGYRSDLTRTFFLGSTPDERFTEVYKTTLAAQTAALEGLRAGISGKTAHMLAHDVISDAGYGENFGHGLGHGLGLDIHEQPRLSRMAPDTPLLAGSVVTVEPGIYLEGWGGVRIEDLVVLTEDGIVLLSHAPKEPIIALQ